MFAVLLLIWFSIGCALSGGIPKQLLINRTSNQIQLNAVKDLIHRTIMNKDSYFVVDINFSLEPQSFQIFKTSANTIRVIGSDGVSAAKGFHYYLKNYLNRSIYWYNKPILLDENLDLPYVNLSLKSASEIIYYQNVCTWGYSFVWWNWSKWISHIDWMVMMGISLTIAPIQEQLWYETYSELGLTENEINSHFSGPAFLPWLRMGNIRGWGGSLGPTYRKVQMILQQKIIRQQRSFGMIVSVPSFSGHLPVAMEKLYPYSNFTRVESWNKFPTTYCCTIFLDPNDSLFKNVTDIFMRKVINNYETDHIYFADPFNEIQPKRADVMYLNMTAYHLYKSMQLVDKEAIWLLQGWMFVKNMFWSNELKKAFLTAVPIGRLLILDLQSEQFPQYEITYSFYGQPFIWCMLHNFGGTLGMHGSVNIINERIRMARLMKNSSMIGVGITPEGINQNYVMYELVLERAWLEKDLNLTQWFNKYSDVRYGIEDDRLHRAWQLLRNSVYSYYGLRKIRGKYILARRPSTRLKVWTWYNCTDVYISWSNLLQANLSIPNTHYNTYEHDLVDITRQFLQTTFDRIYVNLIHSFNSKEMDRFYEISQTLINVLDDMETILATHENFLLGQWLEGAKNLATTTKEKNQFEFNARNQITLWGPSGQIVDYATKQWSGVVKDFFKPRWQLFLKHLNISLINNLPFNNTQFKKEVLHQVEEVFNFNKLRYPVVPHGNTYYISKHIFTIWNEFFLNVEHFNNLFPVNIKIIK